MATRAGGSDRPEREAAPERLRPPDTGSGRLPQESQRDAHARRVGYFMAFRLALLLVFTLLATLSTLRRAGDETVFDTLIWAALGLGFTLTLVFARQLPRIRNLDAFVWVQVGVDIVLSSVVVQSSGGLDSPFTFFYLVAILGAAIMGSAAQVGVAAGACGIIHTTLAFMQMTGVIEPLNPLGAVTTDPAELVVQFVRTAVALAAVGVLASLLNGQLWSSRAEISTLQALNDYIVNSLNSGLITVDPDGTVVDANPTALAMLARDPSTLVGRRLEEALPPLARAVAAPDGRAEFECRVADERAVFGCAFGPLRDAAGVEIGVVIHFQDVTAIRRLENRVRRNERLVAIGQLAASVAHEVRNPLAAMAGSAELIAQSATLGAEDRQLLDVIRREAKRLEGTVSDLLTFTRAQRPNFASVDLAALVADAVTAFGADPANAEVDLQVRAEASATVSADRDLVSQVLWNLLRNAAEATDHQGRITIDVDATAVDATIRVADDGRGIPQDRLPKIFEPFYSTKDGGSGFGLSIADRIVTEHGGTIDAESAPGAGTTFTIVLPRRRSLAPGASVVSLPAESA